MAAIFRPQRFTLQIGENGNIPNGRDSPVAGAETQGAGILRHIQLKCRDQRLQQAAGRSYLALHITDEIAADGGDVESGKAVIRQNGGDGVGKRRRSQPAVQPMARAPVTAIATRCTVLRKTGKGRASQVHR